MKEGGTGGKWDEWSEVWIQGEGNEMKREMPSKTKGPSDMLKMGRTPREGILV